MKPLVSIVIPNWNGAHLLGDCLDSLAGQTYSPIEVVIADGASIDTSLQVAQRHLPGAVFLTLERNYGFSGNVNRGIAAANTRGGLPCSVNVSP